MQFMSSHPRECYIYANDFVFAVNVYDNCAKEFSSLYECNCLLVGVIEVVLM